MTNGQKWLDGAAIGASGLCLVHCLAMPLLFALLPAATEMLALSEGFHLAAFLFAVPASALALLAGYRRHGEPLLVLPGLIGLALLGWGVLGGHSTAIETGLTVLGSLVLAATHVFNWRTSRKAASA